MHIDGGAMLVIISILIILAALLIIFLKLFAIITCGICKTNTCLVGKTALITGGNQGIGYQTALGLAARGCRVIIADKDNADNSRDNIIAETGNPNIICKQFDLSSLDSIRKLAKDILDTEKRLDVLINNAGCILGGNRVTKDGMNFMMQVNHFGPFLFTHLLIDLLKKTPQSKLIFTSSCASFLHTLTEDNVNNPTIFKQQAINDVLVYANSKMCGLITAKYFSDKLNPFGIVSNAAYPGVVNTNIARVARSSNIEESSLMDRLYRFVFDRLFLGCFGKTVRQGAETTLHLATTKDNITGQYFADCGVAIFPPPTRNQELCKGVIKETLKVLKLEQ